MIGRVSRNILSRRGLPLASFCCRRQFSAKAIYSSFPATLLYYSPRQRSSLYDHKEGDSRPDDLFDEGVAELIRRYFDEALDREDGGKEVETPFVYTIPKGVPILTHLILINEYISRFSLRPSHDMLLKDLNRSLDEFYREHASKETAEDWLDKHPFQSAVADDADAIWMAK
ncbi:hypothetical protein QBC46DRAFT_363417 [Diplogelasinospora grovesii]|uniref:Tse2 ADP-ribosyltransferase toxin domain-containing protein n=1 Tax=Diplogelasinospora grovesii TaxID=303347 RepID=A0AAN6S5K8_9PEZI|nr:hypothetical protein QBC46DRAFT_363417 [Diplogelasinospora grovesii]